jgi:hypothetical protein
MSTNRGFKEIHLVVDHPQVGQFVARKLTKPEELTDEFIDRAVNGLERWLKERGGWSQQEPAILVRRK